MKMRNKQGGFTLVEIAIVLVIVGLLLAGVLKGQELIENSRIKSLSKDMDSMAAAVASYNDRYRGLPGDSAVAATNVTNGWGATPFTVGNNDGLIGAVATTFTVGANENTMAMVSMMFAGFIAGNPNAGIPTTIIRPRHAADGAISVTNGAFGFTGRNVICMNGLNGKAAAALDRQFDDGNAITGLIRSNRIALPGNPAIAIPPAGTQFSEAAADNAVPITLCRQV